MYVRQRCSNLHAEDLEILSLDESAAARTANEQSADDPSVDLIRVKNMLNSTISMSYLML